MKNIELENIRRDRNALVQELEQAGAKVRGNTVLCPFHPDTRPSGGVFEKDGIWRYKCLACGAGGDVFNIRALIFGTSAADEIKKLSGLLQSQQKQKPKKQTFANLDAVRNYLQSKVGGIEAEYLYTGLDGDIVQIIFRCITSEGKTFRPCHLTDSGYSLTSPPKPWKLYNLPKLAKAEMTIVLEGEKCCDILSHYGFAATTSAGGAKNAKSTDWAPLAGKSVILWPDNDAEGRRYALDVEQILQTLIPPQRISLIDPARLDLTKGEDVADFVEQLKVLRKSNTEISAALDTVFKTARTLSIAGEVYQRIKDIRSGRYAAIPWPWELVSDFTKALLPSTVTLLAGSAGATKSFGVLQCFAFWQSLNLRVALYEAEEDRTFHLQRALAQESGCAWFTDPDEVNLRADADEIAIEYEAFLEKFGRVIHATPETQPTLEWLALWIEQQAKAGCRIIGIDPVTAALRTCDAWVADANFLRAIKNVARNYGCSIILVTHPVKAVSFPDLSQVAGSACYQRFAQTALWLEAHEEKISRVRTACGTDSIEHDRTIYILKANNGRGRGIKLAYRFDKESLTLSELGVILPKKKERITWTKNFKS